MPGQAVSNTHPSTRYLIGLPTAIGLGLASVCLAVVILGIPPNPEGMFPYIFAEFSWLTLILLFASGIMLGLIFCINPLHPLVLGFATMAAFPVLAFVEMAQNPYSHNLFPIEFAMYGLVSLFAVGGAYAGRALRQTAYRRWRS
ncbi:MAG: hypothetical protein IIB53_11680 [Planctomycetes bacterium]|nr:hypothetical protein [Planctomycetota bacterium]